MIFIIEFFIGIYTHDAFIRPYAGDFLVVIFLYCILRSFLFLPVKPLALIALTIAYLVEFLQYLNVLDFLGWRQSALANVLLGNWFEWADILAYSLGILVTVITERFLDVKNSKVQLFI